MSDLLRIVSQYEAQLILALAAAFLLVALVLWRTAASIRKSRRKMRQLLDETKGESVERMLYDHLRARMELRASLERLAAKVQDLEEKMASSKRHVGLVRYDAFEDVGGEQSFALAIYDDRGDGAIVNSLVGRTDCRVYCKPLQRGRSERSLSQEEQRAIEDAVSQVPKPIVSQ
jgi:hypothetical protein